MDSILRTVVLFTDYVIAHSPGWNGDDQNVIYQRAKKCKEDNPRAWADPARELNRVSDDVIKMVKATLVYDASSKSAREPGTGLKWRTHIDATNYFLLGYIAWLTSLPGFQPVDDWWRPMEKKINEIG